MLYKFTQKEEMVFVHDAPVDALAALPNGFGFVSVGGTFVIKNRNTLFYPRISIEPLDTSLGH